MSTKLSKKLERINTSVSKIRQKANMPDAVIEDLVVAVESMVTPEGSITITENSTVDVSNYAEAVVDVAGGGTAKSNIYKVATIADRDAINDMVEGDMCVVVAGGVENANVNSQFQVAIFPSVVVLPSAITDYIDVRYSAVDSDIMFDGFGMLDSSNFMLDCYTDSGSIRIQYTSSDGKTYTRTTSDEVVDFGTLIYYERAEMWNDLIGYFIQIDGVDFNGLFTYAEGAWEFSKIGARASDYQVDKSCKVYTNDGMVQGVLGTSDGRSINLIENYVTNMDFSNILNCATMFKDIDTDTSLFFNKLNTFNTENATSMEAMFKNCSKITSLDLSHFRTANVKSLKEMFYGCTALTSLNVDNWDVSNVEDASNMLYNTKFTSLNTANWDLNKLKNGESMFRGSRLTSLNAANWGLASLENASRMFYSLPLTSIDASNWTLDNVKNCRGMFYQCGSLVSVKSTNWKMTNVETTREMFDYCSVLTELDTSNWDMGKCTDMGNMFSFCYKLESLDVSKWDTSNVTFMGSLFSSCDKLANLDVSNWNTSKVTSTTWMFGNCYALKNQDFSKWDTSNVTNMSSMFTSCKAMTRLDLSSFNTSKVTNMQTMFYNCTGLQFLDIRNFDFTNVTSYANMLGSGTPTNCLIIVKDTAAKNWLLGKFPTYTNVKTVAEYGG